MSDLKLKKITLGDKDLPLVCDLNVLDDLETRLGVPFFEAFGMMTDLSRIGAFSALRAFFTLLINEGLEIEHERGEMLDIKQMTERQVGRYLLGVSLDKLVEIASDVMTDSLPADDGNPTREGEK